MPRTPHRRAAPELAHTFEDEPIAPPAGAMPPDDETPDTQESLDASDGLWEIAEDDGAGRRHATVEEREIAADGLTILDEDGLEVPARKRSDADSA
jgi:hypothetical protein